MAGCSFAVPPAAAAQSLSSADTSDALATVADTQVPGTADATAAATPLLSPNAAISAADANADTGRVASIGNSTPIDEDFGRINLRESSIDGLKTKTDIGRDDATGVRVGTFILKPALTQTFNHETTKTGSFKERRGYLETGLKGSLVSDWSRHQLSVTADGLWQRNISGSGQTKPSANVDAELRLDLSNDITARLSGGYSFSREDSSDANAVSGASRQSAVNQYSLGAGIERDFGILRGSAKVDFDRYTYGDVTLDDGSRVSQKDRNRNAGTVTTRIGYELSPALIPFLEASLGKSVYDQRTDSLGYQRSYDSYAGRGGVQVDLGEKLNGEIALGYETFRFRDNRLDDLSGVTLDSIINWSPQRGTNITYGISTGLEPSTTAGESGALAYALTSAATYELRSDLVARLSNSLTFRNYPSGSTSPDERVWNTGAGLTWDFTRNLALTGDVSYERTTRRGGQSSSETKVGVGLTLRR